MNKWISGMLAAVCLLTVTGCTYGGEVFPSESETEAVSETEQTTAQEPTTASTSTASSATAAKKAENPLTGLYDLEPGAVTRPVAVMIGNNSRSRPQYGLDSADWYLEAETEGGITRIMAVFANASRVPSQLGPVRSARTPFVLMAQSMDMIYAHAGGSKAALAALAERDMADVNALYYDGSVFWRDSELRRQKGYEYSLMISGNKLSGLTQKLNFRTTCRAKLPFTFSGDPAAGEEALTLQCKLSHGQTVNFKYYPDENLYYKRNGTLDNPSTHATAAGVQLSASNVIILFDRRYAENSTTSTFELKSGSGLLFTAGRVREIGWSRTASSLRFTEKDGSAARVSRGKSYILLVDRDRRSDTFYRK